MAEDIKFNLKVEQNNLDKALDSAAGKADRLGGIMDTALGVFAGGAAIKGLELAGKAFGALVDFAKESVAAAAEQEAAFNRLGQSLRAAGDFSNAAISDFSNFASQLQRVSVFGDEVIIGQIAIAKSFGATNEQAKELVQAAANLSATFGGSLEENVSKLGKSLGGVVSKELKAAIPELKGLSKEALAAGDALGLINKRFGGASISETQSFSGSVVQLKNSFSDFQEELGNFIVKNPAVTEAIGIITKGIIAAAEAAKDGANFFGIYGTKAEEQKGQLVSLNQEYETSTRLIKQLGEAQKNAGLFGQAGDDVAIQGKIAELQMQQLDNLRLQKSIKASIAADELKAAEDNKKAGVGVTLTDEQIQQRLEQEKLLKSEILGLELQFQASKEQSEAMAAAMEIENATLRAEQMAQLEATFREQEIMAIYEAEVAKANILKGQDAIRLATKKASLTRDIAIQKSANAQEAKLNEQKRALELKQEQDFWSAATSLSSSENKGLLAIGKAAALAQLAIKTPEAVGNSYAFGTRTGGPILGAVFGGIASAAMAAQAAKIAGVKGFADGGIVGGEFSGASGGGDNTMITARKDEMFLNAQQQKTLFDAINGGGIGGPIIIQINGREIARAVRDEINNGFRLTA